MDLSLPPEKGNQIDFSAFYQEACNHVGETDYLQKRGLSPEAIKHFRLGYCAHWINPRRPDAPAEPRIIIPVDHQAYQARDPRIPCYGPKKRYNGVGLGIFNKEVLKVGRPVYIVEGEFDAISIHEVGGLAISISGLGGEKRLLEYLKDNIPTVPLIIALDHEVSENLTFTIHRMQQGFQKLGIRYMQWNPYGKYKDANEAFLNAHEEFAQAIAEGEALAEALSSPDVAPEA